MYNLKYTIPKNSYNFYNGFNYDYHFIIRIRRIKKKITCLEENTEKYLTITVPIEKGVKGIDKNGEEITKKYNLHITIY